MDVFVVSTSVSFFGKAAGIAAVVGAVLGTTLLLYGMGAALCPRRLAGHAERLGLGFLFLGCAMSILGAFGALNLSVLLPFFGIAAAYGLTRFPKMERRAPLGLLGWLALALIGLRLLGALLPQAHGDALYYHLPSALAWARAGRVVFIEWLPFALQGGIGEYLYTFVALLLPEPMALQIAGQLLHASWGFALSGLVVHRIARHWLPESWSWVAALGFLTFSAQSGLLITAKNDGYVLALAMLSLLQVSECFQRQDRAREFLAYVFASGAFAVKNTAVFYLVPFVSLFWIFQAFVQHQPPLAVILRHGALAFLSAPLALPALVRNYAFTGNPMFPAMDEHFQSAYLNDRLRAYMKGFSYYPGSPWTILSTQATRLWGSKLFYLFGLAALRTTVPMVRFLWALLGLAFLVLVVMTGRGDYARFHYYLYAVLSLLAATGAERLWRLAAAPWQRRTVVTLATVSLLVGSAVEVSAQQVMGRFVPWLASSESYVTYFGRVKPLLAVQQWMNGHLTHARIFSFAENEVLYLRHPLVVPENHHEANEILASPSFDLAIAGLRRGAYTHVLIPPGREDYFPVLTEDPRFGDTFALLHEVNGYRVYGWKTPD